MQGCISLSWCTQTLANYFSAVYVTAVPLSYANTHICLADSLTLFDDSGILNSKWEFAHINKSHSYSDGQNTDEHFVICSLLQKASCAIGFNAAEQLIAMKIRFEPRVTVHAVLHRPTRAVEAFCWSYNTPFQRVHCEDISLFNLSLNWSC